MPFSQNNQVSIPNHVRINHYHGVNDTKLKYVMLCLFKNLRFDVLTCN
jgi:hypothetical protein